MVDGACQARSSLSDVHSRMRFWAWTLNKTIVKWGFLFLRDAHEKALPIDLLFFFSSGSAPRSSQITYRSLFLFFFFFKSSSHCANRRWQTMLLTFSSPAVSLLPILYRLFLFMISIYSNSSKKHRETSFSSLVFFHPILALKRKFSFSKSSFTKWWITRSINWYN